MRMVKLASREMHEPFLSVIIPVYNAEKYLKKCFDSIRSQTFRDYEIIVIDDGSTDASCIIANRYKNKDDRISVYSKENGGCYAARLYGISKSRGEYVIFCDADDYHCNKHAFEKIHEYIVAYNCDVVQFGFKRKYNHLSRKHRLVKRPMLIERNTFLLQEYPRLICSSCRAGHLGNAVWTKVYRKECFCNMSFTKEPERIFWWEDVVINMQVLINIERILFVPDVFYTYRQYSGGTCFFSEQMMKDLDIVKSIQLRYMNEYYPNDENMIETLFSETASMIYWWVKQAVEQLDEDDVKVLVSETMCLPIAIKATEYYRYQNRYAHRASVDLLRKADPDEYIRHMKAKKDNQIGKKYGKRELIALVKDVYRWI